MLIKRIIGMPGDEISLEDGAVYVNGKQLDEPYVRTVDGETVPTEPFDNGLPWSLQQPYTVPAGNYFVMGDNRIDSGDSREFGPVPRGQLVGKAFARYWPPGRIGGVRLSGREAGQCRSASPSIWRPPAPTARPSPAPTRPAAAVWPARSPSPPSASTTRRWTRPAAKPSPASTTPSASPARVARRSTTRSCGWRARSWWCSSLRRPSTATACTAATCAVSARALERLDPAPDVALVDGFPLPDCAREHRAVVGGDHLSAAIAAASIVAKVTRDRVMRGLHESYPAYGFDHHVGYATAVHQTAICEHGVCELHRLSFASVAYQQLGLGLDATADC